MSAYDRFMFMLALLAELAFFGSAVVWFIYITNKTFRDYVKEREKDNE